MQLSNDLFFIDPPGLHGTVGPDPLVLFMKKVLPGYQGKFPALTGAKLFGRINCTNMQDLVDNLLLFRLCSKTTIKNLKNNHHPNPKTYPKASR
jgi:hypothetical protein